MNLSGIDDFLERTDHHLPYPLRRIRPTNLVVTVTFGVVDTCSISPGDGLTEVTRVILRFQRKSVAFLKEPGGNSRIPRNGIIITPLLGRNTTLVSEPTCQPSLLTTPFRFLDAFLQGQTTFKTESGNNF